MTTFFFADNTVLVNFALMGRLDLLERLLRGQGRWCRVVAQECDRSSRLEGLGDLTGVGKFLGEPVEPERREQLDTSVIRDRLIGPRDVPTKSLGEAETLAVVSSRFGGSWFVTDDRGAQREAQQLGIPRVTTGDLILLALRVEFVSPTDAWALVQILQRKQRGVLRDCRSLSELLARAGLRRP